MEKNAGAARKEFGAQEEGAKTAILGECDKLAQAGVSFVAARFDRYGHDGATEEVKCFNVDKTRLASWLKCRSGIKRSVQITISPPWKRKNAPDPAILVLPEFRPERSF